jgi:oxygen-independent coproporphyrinogen-3 oxidase
MRQTIGIYIHIPFCAQKCSYCDFASVAGASDALMDSYGKVLTNHIREAAGYVDNIADTVYIGGGTPSLWGVKRIDGLMKQLRKNFQISPNAEITMEANPDSVTPKSLEKWRKSGINRISIGVQTTNDELLKTLGRPHTAQQAADAAVEASRAGFDNISVDLLFGLPGQTQEQWQQTLRTAVGWPVTHISCYALKVEENTPLHRSWGSTPCIDDEAAADQYLLAVEYLEQHGYLQYEISNFSKPSRQSRHNLKYWRLEPYLGFGASAHSDFGNLRYANTSDIHAYIKGIAEGETVITENERMEPHDRAREYIMLGLRTAHGVNEEEYVKRFHSSFDRPLTLLSKWEPYGLTASENGRWRLTPKGFLVSNRLILELLGERVKP